MEKKIKWEKPMLRDLSEDSYAVGSCVDGIDGNIDICYTGGQANINRCTSGSAVV